MLSHWKQGDEGALKSLITRYQRYVFAIVLCLTGCDRNIAYDITTSAFLETIRRIPSLGSSSFLLALIRLAVDKCRQIKPVSFTPPSDVMNISPQKGVSLRIVKEALLMISFDLRVPLLLRDQLNLSYEDIASVLGDSEKNAKSQTIHARIQLRDKIEETLNRQRTS